MSVGNGMSFPFGSGAGVHIVGLGWDRPVIVFRAG